MKRSLPFLALTVATLLLPAAALAAPVVPATRIFEIRALVLGPTRLEVSGKLWLDGATVGASVGCNSIGAKVTVDGDVVSIVGPATMTEMACPGAAGNAEAMLLKILELGRFTIGDGKWSADGGAIEVIEASAPDPNQLPPDGTTTDPNGVVCSNTLPGGGPTGGTGVDDATPPDAGSGSGSGSGGSSGGSTGGGVTQPVPAAPTPADAPCVAVNGGQVGIDKIAPGSIGSEARAPIVDTARDVLFVPLAIGFGVLLLVTAGLLLRGRVTPR